MAKYCPECGTEVKKKYKFCVKCGYKFPGYVSLEEKKSFEKEVEKELKRKEEDTTPPTVKIKKPETALYIYNKRIMPFFTTIIIGSVVIEVDALDYETGINSVEFYIDAELQETNTTEPYDWTWDKPVFGRRMIKVVAFDNAGNHINKVKCVWKFF